MIDLASVATAALKSSFLHNLAANFAANLAVGQNELVGTFNSYLDRTYDQHSKLKSVVLRDEVYLLNDLYVPLRLVKAASEGSTEEPILLDEFPTALFAKSRCVTVVDTAGMGKSTLARYLFIKCAQGSERVPFLIDLRSLSVTRNIETAIAESLCGFGTKPDSWMFKLISSLANRPSTVVFFDGFDEVSDANKAAISRDIQEFVTKSKCSVMMTSRETGGLAGFSAFAHYNIAALTLEESQILIRKYAKALGRIEVGSELIRELEKPANAQVKPFLTNPLLTSMLFTAFDYKHEIPLKKSSFYLQVFEALFDKHDSSKPGGFFAREKHSQLDRPDFATVIRYFSAFTYREQRYEYSHFDLLNQYLSQVQLALPAIKFDANGLIQDLVETVPLLVLEGQKYRWAHRSLQEFFVAAHICQDESEHRTQTLHQMAHSRRNLSYHGILDLCAELSPNDWRQSVLRPVLESCLNHRDTMRKALGELGFSHEQADLRAALTYYAHFAVISIDGLDPVNAQRDSRMLQAHRNAIKQLEKQANDCSEAQIGLGLTNPCLVVALKRLQVFGLVSGAVQLFGLHKFAQSHKQDLPESIRRTLIEVLATSTHYSTNTSKDNPLYSPKAFTEINMLLGTSGIAPLDWGKVESLLKELNIEREQINAAKKNRSAW